MKLHYFIKKIVDVKPKDLLSSISYIVALFMSKVIGQNYRDYWLVCEDPMEARDNGYWFFKYLCEKTTTKCCYAIKKTSPDYDKVNAIGETVDYGSIKHWLLYLSGTYNISSQKGGKPNAALCAFLELNNLVSVKNVFLQHGVTINNARWLYSDCSRFFCFITSTRPETDYIIEHFGYPEGTVQYTGFSRFDTLHDYNTKKNRVLIMPSWRAWFSEKSSQVAKTDKLFVGSDYLLNWRELLCSEKLKRLIEEKNLEVIFYPHRNMQKYLSFFENLNKNVTIGSSKEYDVQELLKTSELLITDYSSVFFDMAYMKKPVIFFQFDEEKFRAQQYQAGYFDYHHTVFGDFCTTSGEVLNSLEKHVNDGFQVSDAFLYEHRRVFEKYDDHNTERIYGYLKKAMEE